MLETQSVEFQKQGRGWQVAMSSIYIFFMKYQERTMNDGLIERSRRE